MSEQVFSLVFEARSNLFDFRIYGGSLKKLLSTNFNFPHSMEGSDLCFEVVRRAVDGFVYSEAVAW